MRQAFRKRFGCGLDSFGFERTAVFDYCAKDDKPWGSKYRGISEVVMGLSRKILHQGVDHISSCVHKSTPENDKLSRFYLMLSSHLYRGCPQDLFLFVRAGKLLSERPDVITRARAHTHTHTHTIYIYIYIYIYTQ
jgi:hypothetical protein